MCWRLSSMDGGGAGRLSTRGHQSHVAYAPWSPTFAPPTGSGRSAFGVLHGAPSACGEPAHGRVPVRPPPDHDSSAAQRSRPLPPARRLRPSCASRSAAARSSRPAPPPLREPVRACSVSDRSLLVLRQIGLVRLPCHRPRRDSRRHPKTAYQSAARGADHHFATWVADQIHDGPGNPLRAVDGRHGDHFAPGVVGRLLEVRGVDGRGHHGIDVDL